MSNPLITDSSLDAAHPQDISSESDSAHIGGTCRPVGAAELVLSRSRDRAPGQPHDGFVPAVKESAFVKANMGDPGYAARYAAVVADALSMTKSELQTRYKSEYNSLRSRRAQAKSRHIKFFDNLKDIRDWLIHLGPIPSKGWTVDRIRALKSEGYQPGNLRWATKAQQTQNRKVTKWHLLPDGSRLTTMQLAERLGLPYPKVYKRLRSGWTVDRILQQGVQPTLKSWKFPRELAQHCDMLYQQRKFYPQHRIDWFIEYLDDVLYKKLDGKWGMPGNAIPKLAELLNSAREERKTILEREKAREDQKLSQLLNILDPPKPSLVPPPVQS